MAVYRVLLGNQNPAFIAAARKHLTLATDRMVVGFAQSGDDVIAQIIALQPEVLLLSINLPDGGLALVRRIKKLAEAPVVIVLALDNLDDYRAAAIEAGADGFAAKSEVAVQSIPLIRTLCLPITPHK